MDTLTHDEIRAAVRNRYGTIAETRGVSTPTDEGSCCGSTASVSCCGSDTATTLDTKAHAYGYSAEDTSAVPEGANLGLGCGNPIALASLRPGRRSWTSAVVPASIVFLPRAPWGKLAG